MIHRVRSSVVYVYGILYRIQSSGLSICPVHPGPTNVQAGLGAGAAAVAVNLLFQPPAADIALTGCRSPLLPAFGMSCALSSSVNTPLANQQLGPRVQGASPRVLARLAMHRQASHRRSSMYMSRIARSGAQSTRLALCRLPQKPPRVMSWCVF